MKPAACFHAVLASGHRDSRSRTAGHQQRLASSRLGCRARHNGHGVYCERAPLGRVHCYLTGPFFFLIALVALSYGLGVLHLGGNGWNLLGLIALIVTIALWYLPEMFLGKYRQRN
jgi:hypothetical protein